MAKRNRELELKEKKKAGIVLNGSSWLWKANLGVIIACGLILGLNVIPFFQDFAGLGYLVGNGGLGQIWEGFTLDTLINIGKVVANGVVYGVPTALGVAGVSLGIRHAHHVRKYKKVTNVELNADTRVSVNDVEFTADQEYRATVALIDSILLPQATRRSSDHTSLISKVKFWRDAQDNKRIAGRKVNSFKRRLYKEKAINAEDYIKIATKHLIERLTSLTSNNHMNSYSEGGYAWTKIARGGGAYPMTNEEIKTRKQEIKAIQSYLFNIVNQCEKSDPFVKSIISYVKDAGKYIDLTSADGYYEYITERTSNGDYESHFKNVVSRSDDLHREISQYIYNGDVKKAVYTLYGGYTSQINTPAGESYRASTELRRTREARIEAENQRDLASNARQQAETARYDAERLADETRRFRNDAEDQANASRRLVGDTDARVTNLIDRVTRNTDDLLANTQTKADTFIEELGRHSASADKESARIKEIRENAEKDLTDLRKDIADHKQEIADIQAEVQKVEKIKTDLEKLITELKTSKEEDKQTILKEISTLYGKFDGTNKRLTDAFRFIQNVQKQVTELKNVENNITPTSQNEIEKIEKFVETLSKKIEQLATANVVVTAQMKKINQELKTHEEGIAKNSELSTIYADNIKHLKQLETEIADLGEALNIDYSWLLYKIQKLKQDIDTPSFTIIPPSDQLKELRKEWENYVSTIFITLEENPNKELPTEAPTSARGSKSKITQRVRSDGDNTAWYSPNGKIVKTIAMLFDNLDEPERSRALELSKIDYKNLNEIDLEVYIEFIKHACNDYNLLKYAKRALYESENPDLDEMLNKIDNIDV